MEDSSPFILKYLPLFTIRELKRSDLIQCVELFKLNSTANMLEDYAIVQLINELNASFEPTMFVTPRFILAEENKKIIGFAGYSNTGFDDEIFGLFWINVHPDHRNRGIGKALTKFRIEEIKKIGGKIILSTTRKTWHLERFGFTKDSSLSQNYYLMKLEL
jgi:N-acetylglutamate synthase-like GNAT family acetyltransferase